MAFATGGIQVQNETLTTTVIQELGPKPRRYQVADGDGLFLEVQPSGVKSWRVRYSVNGTPAITNVGRWPEVKIREARDRRAKIKAAARRGLYLAEAERVEEYKAAKNLTVEQFCERYMREVVKKRRPKSWEAMHRYFKRNVYPVMGSKRMDAVTLYDLRCMIFVHRDRGHDQAAMALRDLLKRAWDYAVICDVVTSNPLLALQRKFIATASSRRRFLSAQEVGVFISRVRNSQRLRRHLKAAMQLILLTLTRKSEMLKARWKHIDLQRGEWLIPAAHTKNNQDHVVYLSRQAMALLETLAMEYPGGNAPPSFYVIHRPASKTQPISQSTLNRALARISKGFEHFTVHDLRRTAATLLSEDEYQQDVIEKALNHTIKGVRGVYNRAKYKRQRKQMLADWGDKVEDYAIEFGQGRG